MTIIENPVDGEGLSEGDEPIREVEAATPEFEAAAIRAESRRGFLMALPAYAYLAVFFAIPLIIVFIYSFATRNSFGGTDLSGWNLNAYRKLGEPIVREILFRSLWFAILTTVICLVVGYPFAYYLSTLRPWVRNLLLVFVMIPFWSNFLVRNYAWRVLLGRDGLVSDSFDAVGLGSREYLFTPTAVMIGLVYGFLPFMILPLYASIDRIDPSLLEASRDLYASGWQTFRRVLLPLSMPGVIAGSILTFVPSLGAYVTPEILGGAKTTLLGSYIVTQFLTARNWPVGASLSFVLMTVMLASTLVYFRSGGRNL
jgi:spermidine/putrescine transport system permease protein